MNHSERAHVITRLREVISRRQIAEMVPMNRYTTLRLGGPADILVEISADKDLETVFSIAAEEKVPVTVIGRGSNLLVRDGGIRGICIHFGDEFARISDAEAMQDGRYKLTAQSGATLIKLCGAAADAELSGLEFAGGIPGSVGGAVYMNAGAYGGQMSDCVSSVRIMHRDGRIETLENPALSFDYRHSALMEGDSVVLSASVLLTPGDGDMIRAAMREFNARRREKQPLSLPSCGSTFKRPQGQFAGTLIEQCGLKGMRVGGCSVSELHAGFLVNDEGGTADDYETLMRNVAEIVREKIGVQLQSEVRILGDSKREED